MDHARGAKRPRITATPVPAAAAGNGATICDDLLISEVLVRLPVKSLARFRSVCRKWRAAIAEPAFVRRHLDLSRRARPPSLLLIPRPDTPDDDYSTLSDDISFHVLKPGQVAGAVARDEDAKAELMLEVHPEEELTCRILPTHCDGLVAIATATDRVFVCNPATKEFVALPLVSRDADDFKTPAAAIAFDPWRKRYVVARYFYRRFELSMDVVTGEHQLDFDIGHEVFVLGSGDGAAWELTEDPPDAIASKGAICTRGAIYWCVDSVSPKAPNTLLRFSLRDRKFAVVPCPPGCTSGGVAGDHLTSLDGKLCYVRAATASAMDIWVADDRPRLQWSLRCRIDVDADVGCDGFFPVVSGEGKMLVAVDYNKLYSYSERSMVFDEVIDMEEELEYKREDGSEYGWPECALLHHVLPYRESLVPIRKWD